MKTLIHENKQTLKLAFPIISSHVGQMLLGLSDTLMIGRVGTVELAAAAFMNILMHLTMVLGIGLSVAVSVQVSHAHGSNLPKNAAEALRHALAWSLVIGLTVCLTMILGFPLMHHLGQPPEVMRVLPGYLKWVAGSLTFMMPVMVMKSFAESKNHPWPVFWIQLAGVLLNIVLNAFLIFGLAGFPALGITGAGLATFLARLATLIAMAIYLRRSITLADSIPKIWVERLRLHDLRELFRLSAPITAQLLMEFGAFAACALMIGRLGPQPMAAHQIALTCASITFMLPMGLSGALGIRVGHALGAGQVERCQTQILGAQFLTVITMLGFAVIYLTFGREIARAFTPDPELIRLTVSLLTIAGIFQLFDGIQVVSIGALRAMKDITVPTLLGAVGYWIIGFPTGIFLGKHMEMGVTGFWIGLGIGLGTAAFTMSIRLFLQLRHHQTKV
ncbi:MAG: MATE family efflux transporter [Verrucomicrobia bacterium]|nr:MATE family efflux transporter [Verrucomicrobiota bacterium]MCH8511029.1 MATE family efflux transporter [Kiritimatiellia bacterium]